MSTIYFPSCNFDSMAPKAAKALRACLAPRMPIAGCCRADGLDHAEGSTALYLCQACRQTLEKRAPGKYRTKNVFEYLLEDKDFKWPDYSGLTVTIQDCWRDRGHPEIFAAVREALRRMKAETVEMAENREQTVFCGNIHFEPGLPENIALMERYGDKPMAQMPEEVQLRFMKEQAAKYPCGTVITYCNRCTLCMRTAGVNVIHLMELAMGTY